MTRNKSYYRNRQLIEKIAFENHPYRLRKLSPLFYNILVGILQIRDAVATLKRIEFSVNEELPKTHIVAPMEEVRQRL